MIEVLFDKEQFLDLADMNEALVNSNKFNGLGRREKLEVLIEDVIRNTDVNKNNYDIWKEESVEAYEDNSIIEDFKVKQILKVLENDSNPKCIDTLTNLGILEYCLPKLFTKIDKNITIYLTTYSKNVGSIVGNSIDKFIVLLAIFPIKLALETLASLNIKDDKDIYINSLTLLEDFTIINEKDGLKKFIHINGIELYEYLFKLSGNLVRAYEFSKFRYLSKKYLLEEIYALGEPIFPEDLNITRDDLIESELANKETVDELMLMITEHLINNPNKNRKEVLLKTAEQLNKNKLFKIFRKVKWIK